MIRLHTAITPLSDPLGGQLAFEVTWSWGDVDGEDTFVFACAPGDQRGVQRIYDALANYHSLSRPRRSDEVGLSWGVPHAVLESLTGEEAVIARELQRNGYTDRGEGAWKVAARIAQLPEEEERDNPLYPFDFTWLEVQRHGPGSILSYTLALRGARGERWLTTLEGPYGRLGGQWTEPAFSGSNRPA